MGKFRENDEMIDFEENIEINTKLLSFKEEINKFIIYWKWYVISVTISFLFAFFYLRYTKPLYKASSFIMIKDNLDAGISDELKAVSDLGIVGTSSTNNPDNEVFIITSRKIIGRLVDSLELNIRYFTEGSIIKSENYKDSSVEIQFLVKDSLYHNLNKSFIISLYDENTFLLKNNEGEILKKAGFNKIVELPTLGKFKILKNTNSIEDFKSLKEVFVVIKPRSEVIDKFKSKIQVKSVYKKSSVLNLIVSDPVKLRSENILDELVKQYNLDAANDKNLVSIKTKEFIEERLQSVGLELGIIQDNLKEYKSKFGISGHSKESEIAIESISENRNILNELTIQLSLIEWAEQEITKQLYVNKVLPSNIGLSDKITIKSIEEFNQLVIKRYRLERIAGTKNPNLISLSNEINLAKQNLLYNLKNLKKSIKIQIKKNTTEGKLNKDKVSEIPIIERGMIDIIRQKNIYSELYSYLLKKKEELAISLAVTVPNAKIIDVAYSSDTPLSPRKNIIYFISLIFGLLVASVFIYIRVSLDTKIHVRKDIESNLKIPFLGDIPISQAKSSLIIKNNTRTSVAEAFRLLRTNLNFILSTTDNLYTSKMIFITSTISGEGKSFVSINLAASLGLTGKKVLLLGMDLRAPKINNYLEVPDQKGVTNFILDDTLSLENIKFRIPEVANVDFISSGLIPPNPSELLLNDRVKFLFKAVKQEYDYVIVDTAPISLVTDTLLIAKYADMFLYVVRANHLDKRMLIVPKTLYKEKKLPNMAIVLNGTDIKRGYGYGYGYVQKEEKSFYKKLF